MIRNIISLFLVIVLSSQNICVGLTAYDRLVGAESSKLAPPGIGGTLKSVLKKALQPVGEAHDEKKSRVIEDAKRIGLKLNKVDRKDLDDPYFMEVTDKFIKDVAELGVNKATLNKMYKPVRVLEVKIKIKMDSRQNENSYRLSHTAQ